MRLIALALLTCSLCSMPVFGELDLEPVDEPDAASLDAGQAGTGVVMRAGGGQGGTAMHWMAFNGDEAGVSQLIISGADVNSRLKTGGTPLHLAAYQGHAKVVRLLLEHGAKVNARTKAGVTPLEWARRNGHDEVARQLVSYGAKPGATNMPGSPGLDALDPESGDNAGSMGAAPAPKKFSLMGLPPEGSVVVLKEPQPEIDQVAQPPARPRPAGGGYRIQLGAFGTKQGAADAWAHYQKKFPRQLNDRELLVDPVEVKGKTFYRVQTGPMSRPDAWEICGDLKQAGQSCAVMKRAKP